MLGSHTHKDISFAGKPSVVPNRKKKPGHPANDGVKLLGTPGNDDAEEPDGPLTLRQKIDKTLNEPDFSTAAKYIALIVISSIVVSTVTFVIGTEAYFKQEPWASALNNIEMVVVAIFTVEYVCRFLVYDGNRCVFIVSPMNLVDLAAITPFYAELLFTDSSASSVLRVLRVLRVARVFRVFKAAKGMDSVTTFTVCMINSGAALQILTFFFGIAVLVFSSLMYYAEKGQQACDALDNCTGAEPFLRSDGEESPFTSIPFTFWWAVVTMTTVGYGDVYPVEPSGKLVATLAMVSGVIVLALPISVIGNNFSDAYTATIKAKALRELQQAEDADSSGHCEEFEHCAKLIEYHAAELEKVGWKIQAIMAGAKGPAARGLVLQFDQQQTILRQVASNILATVTNRDVIQSVIPEAAGTGAGGLSFNRSVAKNFKLPGMPHPMSLRLPGMN